MMVASAVLTCSAVIIVAEDPRKPTKSAISLTLKVLEAPAKDRNEAKDVTTIDGTVNRAL
jgi:hypothetical protein